MFRSIKARLMPQLVSTSGPTSCLKRTRSHDFLQQDHSRLLFLP